MEARPIVGAEEPSILLAEASNVFGPLKFKRLLQMNSRKCYALYAFS